MQMLTLTSSRLKPRAKVIAAQSEAQARLQELSPDLSLELFSTVMLSGLGARNEATPASPPTAAGVMQWVAGVTTLRTLLVEKQWRLHNQQNCPFISTPDYKLSIVVMTGSHETGLQELKDPSNQAEKGLVAQEFITANHQFDLFTQDALRFLKSEHEHTQVWILLYHFDKVLNEVRFELSYPTEFNHKKITAWGERIILGSISNAPELLSNPEVDQPNMPATVDVKPKTGTF